MDDQNVEVHKGIEFLLQWMCVNLKLIRIHKEGVTHHLLPVN